MVEVISLGLFVFLFLCYFDLLIWVSFSFACTGFYFLKLFQSLLGVSEFVQNVYFQ